MRWKDDVWERIYILWAQGIDQLSRAGKNQLISLTCWTNISREVDVEEIPVD